MPNIHIYTTEFFLDKVNTCATEAFLYWLVESVPELVYNVKQPFEETKDLMKILSRGSGGDDSEYSARAVHKKSK